MYDEVIITVSPGNVPSDPQIIGTSPSKSRGIIYRDNHVYSAAYENGLDVVNADMQNFKHLEENLVAAATAHTYFG